MSNQERIQKVQQDWETNPRWKDVTRPYTAEDVIRLRGSLDIDYTLATLGAKKLWEGLNSKPYMAGLGALNGNQAIQEVQQSRLLK